MSDCLNQARKHELTKTSDPQGGCGKAANRLDHVDRMFNCMYRYIKWNINMIKRPCIHVHTALQDRVCVQPVQDSNIFISSVCFSRYIIMIT